VKSRTYIVAWDEVLRNTEDTTAQLAAAGHEYVVIDVSTSEEVRPSWVKTETVRYYNHFIWALSDFAASDRDIFVFNAGDPSFNRVGEYTSKAERIFSDDSNVWLLAPNCGNDHFTNDGVKIVDSKKAPGLYLATHTNGIWVFFSRDIATKMHEFLTWASTTGKLDFSTMVSGWGLDTVYCAMSVYHNKKIYRDSSVLISHPQGSSYNYDKANKEYYDVVGAYLEYVESNGQSKELVSKICQTIFDKVNKKQNLQLSIEKVYVNLAAALGEI